MTPITRLAVALAVASLSLLHAAVADSKQLGFEYLSPLPGSIYHLPETNIILRPGGKLDPGSVSREKLRINGSRSGSHQGRLKLSDDRKEVTFQPDVPFAPGEVVTCSLDPGLVTDTGEPVPPAEFTFTVAGPEREALRDFVVPVEGDEDATPEVGGSDAAPAPAAQTAALPESLPSDFPNIQAAVYGTPTPGRLFLCNFVFGGIPKPSYLMILENDGTPFFYRKLPRTGFDFKMQPDGRLTYFDAAARCYYALNANYAVVDSFRCGNGYSTDNHDLLLLPNGHAVLMSYDPQVVDLSLVVKDGRPNAIVVGLIIQELDREKNVVFQWRSWDHFQITDAVSHSLTRAVVDYVHGNSVDADADGDFIISSRHMNEVTKISRNTGEMLWRLGGRNNQFAFIDDPLLFSHQHAARWLPNGNMILFDNGNFRLPLLSRAVEYAIDEVQKTATLVWQHRLNPDVYGSGLGYAQRFSNGNTLISWGSTTPTMTEVAPDGSIVSRLTLVDPGMASYRTFRFEWPPVRRAVVEIQPAVLAIGSRGGWVTAVIRPEAADFSLSDVEPSTIRLNGTVPADTASAYRGDTNGDGLPDLRIRFDRNALLSLLSLGANRVEVSGSLTTGEIFRGSAEVTAGVPRTQQADPPSTPSAEAAPRVLALDRPVPNPSSGAIRVRLGLPREGPAELAVFDLAGRLVARLSTERRPAGWHDLTWDGRDRSGRPVASGAYFVRLTAGATVSRRFVVLR